MACKKTEELSGNHKLLNDIPYRAVVVLSLDISVACEFSLVQFKKTQLLPAVNLTRRRCQLTPEQTEKQSAIKQPKTEI